MANNWNLNKKYEVGGAGPVSLPEDGLCRACGDAYSALNLHRGVCFGCRLHRAIIYREPLELSTWGKQ